MNEPTDQAATCDVCGKPEGDPGESDFIRTYRGGVVAVLLTTVCVDCYARGIVWAAREARKHKEADR